MSKIRLFVDDSFQEGALLSLSPDQAHYLLHVMRLKEAHPVHVFNGKEGEWRSTFVMHKRHPQLRLETPVLPQLPSPTTGLIFSPLKPKRLEFLIEKATELNVGRLYPCLMDHTSSPKFNGDKVQHYAIEAAEQSERLSIPALHPLMKLDDLLGTWPPELPIFWAHERREGTPSHTILQNISRDAPFTFLVGPEGGFSKREIQMLSALPFVIPMSLGHNILRAETAALVCLSFGMMRD